MKKLRFWLQPLLTVLVFLVAVWLLRRELKHYHFHEIAQSLRDIPARRVVTSLALMALNYLILIGYEYQAMRAIGHPLEFKRIALGSFIGSAVSLNFGALLGGTPIRIRLYASWGLSAVEITKLMAMLGITFWVGALSLAGIVFIFDPVPIPPELQLPVTNVRPLGFLFLIVAAAYVSLSALRRKPINFRGQQFSLPSLGLTLNQILIASLDQMVAAGVMFALVPATAAITYPQFLGVYLLTVVAVLITHIPGGVGVLELIMLTLVESNDKEAMAAALIAFRVVYFLLPLLAAALLFLFYECWNLLRPRKT
ncbi:MAG: YbhN family protein [Planctomycetaceae bacterium]